LFGARSHNLLHHGDEPSLVCLAQIGHRLKMSGARRPFHSAQQCGTALCQPAALRPAISVMNGPFDKVTYPRPGASNRQGPRQSRSSRSCLDPKYCDHLPLYRQSQIFARHGAEIDRSTLANWVGGACWRLEPLQARLAAHVFGSTKLFCRRHADPGTRSRPRPQPAGCGSMRVTIDPGPDPNRRPPSTSTVRIANEPEKIPH